MLSGCKEDRINFLGNTECLFFKASDLRLLTLLQFTVKTGEEDFLIRSDGLNSPRGGDVCNLHKQKGII